MLVKESSEGIWKGICYVKKAMLMEKRVRIYALIITLDRDKLKHILAIAIF